MADPGRPGGLPLRLVSLAAGAAGTALAVYALAAWVRSQQQQPQTRATPLPSDPSPVSDAAPSSTAATSATATVAASALTLACKMGDVAGVDAALAALAGSGSVDGARDERGTPALAIAAAVGARDVVTRLLAAGGDPLAPDATGLTALHHAAGMGHLDVLAALTAAAPARGASARDWVNARRPSDGTTPLMLAAAQGHDTVVGWLLGAGAAPDAATTSGARVTAAHAAAQRDHAAVLAALLAAGADADAPDARGRSPLAVAARYGALEAARVLLDAGRANPNGYRGGGGSGSEGGDHVVADAPLEGHPHPLVVAARRGHARLVAALLAAGAVADVRLPPPDGRTLLHAAVEGWPDGRGRLLFRRDVVAALLAGGADPRAERLVTAAADGGDTAASGAFACAADAAGACPDKGVSRLVLGTAAAGDGDADEDGSGGAASALDASMVGDPPRATAAASACDVSFLSDGGGDPRG